MILRYVLLLSLFTPMLAQAQGPGPMEKVKLSRAIQFHLPNNMRPMTPEEINNKYLSSRPPLAMYTTADAKVDFGIKLSNSSFMEADLPMAAQFYKSSLVSLYDSVNFLREELEEINGRTYLVLEFTSTVRPRVDSVASVMGNAPTTPIQRYTYIQYAVAETKLVVFNFSCPLVYMDAWRATAWDIMHSLKVKKTL